MCSAHIYLKWCHPCLTTPTISVGPAVCPPGRASGERRERGTQPRFTRIRWLVSPSTWKVGIRYGTVPHHGYVRIWSGRVHSPGREWWRASPPCHRWIWFLPLYPRSCLAATCTKHILNPSVANPDPESEVLYLTPVSDPIKDPG